MLVIYDSITFGPTLFKFCVRRTKKLWKVLIGHNILPLHRHLTHTTGLFVGDLHLTCVSIRGRRGPGVRRSYAISSARSQIVAKECLQNNCQTFYMFVTPLSLDCSLYPFYIKNSSLITHSNANPNSRSTTEKMRLTLSYPTTCQEYPSQRFPSSVHLDNSPLIPLRIHTTSKLTFPNNN